MSYATELAKISRTPITLMVMTLDYCGETFGASPCTATGAHCYNTFHTCKDKTNFDRQTKEYKFTSNDAPLPFKTGERPYLKSVKYLPTEIKTNLTVTGRVTAELFDEPDTDIGIDPYVSERASVQGTFWKKLLARNPNYKTRPIEIYEGFTGLAVGEFSQKWVGVIDNITINENMVKVEIVDLIKSLNKIEVPPKLDIKLLNDITDSQTSMILTTVEGLDDPAGYVRDEDEIIYYTAVDTEQNEISGCTRGYFSTTAAEHSAKSKVQKVRYYAPANPFDMLKEMLLTDAGVDAGHVDSTGFDYWRDWPGGEINFSAIISEPTKLDELYFEIVDLLDCKSWVGEDLKITIRRNITNEPGRSYTYLTDAANIIEKSADSDLNAKSRISRVLVYWEKQAIGKADDVNSYDRLDIAIDADAESADDYGEVEEKKFFCRWLRSGYLQEELLAQFVKDFAMRRVWRQRDPLPILTFSLELKDSAVKTGEYIRISTDELLNDDGTSLAQVTFQVVKRDTKGNKLTIRSLQANPEKIGFIAPDATPDYDSATAAQKEYGFITDEDGLIDGEPGYHIW